MVEIDIFELNNDLIENVTYDKPVRLMLISNSQHTRRTVDEIPKPNFEIVFKNVTFKSEVSIGKDDGVAEEVSIGFFNCFIDSMSTSGAILTITSFHFRNSYCGHLTASENKLCSFYFNNSFGNYNIFKAKKVEVSYREDNIFVREWYKKQSLDKILSSRTFFDLRDIERVNFYGNEVDEDTRKKLLKHKNNLYFNEYDKTKIGRLKMLLSEDEKKMLDINIYLENSSDFDVNNKITIRGVLLKSLMIKGRITHETSIEDTKIDDFYLRDFSSKSNFTLYNVKPILEKGKFEIHNSNLDNTWFNSVSLKNYLVVFYKSSFINAKFSSTIFPNVKELLNSNSLTSVRNIHFPDKRPDERLFYRNMYELFLELKQVFEKRSNTIEAQKMKAAAYTYLYRIESWNMLKSNFWNNKLVLMLNRVTNFYGISIRNSFWTAVIFIVLFHSLNVLFFSSYELGINSWEEYGQIVSKNFRYLFIIANPTHKLSSLAPDGEITNATYVISFFSRIFIGYAYFQFIAAFRRFGK